MQQEEISLFFSLEDPLSARHDIVGNSGIAARRRYATAAGKAETSREISFSYGRQLTGAAEQLYVAWVCYYYASLRTGKLQIESGMDDSFYTYESVTCMAEEEFDTQACQDLVKEAKKDMQAALDAFTYDCPQVFWTRRGECTLDLAFSEDPLSSTGYRGYIAKITYSPEEIFPGAGSYLSEFMSRTAAVSRELAESIGYSAIGQSTGDAEETSMNVSSPEREENQIYEYLRAAHDYICSHAWYDSGGLESYRQTGDYRIFSAGGVFVDAIGGGVVCEGYARAFKILCDLAEIPCVCIGGYAGGGSHMWNAVAIGGDWYLVDVTWDDLSGQSDYFLSGCSYAQRIPTGDLSETRLNYFKTPFLSQKAYQRNIPQTVADETDAKREETEAGAETETEAETGAATETEVETETEAEAEAETEEETETETAAETETETEAETEAETETDTKTEAEAETTTKTRIETESAVDIEPGTEREPETDKGTEASTEPESARGFGGDDGNITETNSMGKTESAKDPGFRDETWAADTQENTEKAKTKTRPAKTRITSIKRKGKLAILRWKKVKNADGYQIRYAYSRKMKRKRTIKIPASGKTKYTLKKLKRSKTLYIQIRTYTIYKGKKIYSKWSAVKKSLPRP